MKTTKTVLTADQKTANRKAAAVKAAATRKANLAKANAAKLAATTKKEHSETAKQAVAQVKAIKHAILASGYNYPGGKGSSSGIRRSATIAAMVVSGFTMISKTGLLSDTGKGNYSTFRNITGGRVDRVWSKEVMTNKAVYIPKAQNSMEGKDAHGYNGHKAIIDQFIDLMTNGGTRTVKDDTKGVSEKVSFIPVDNKA